MPREDASLLAARLDFAIECINAAYSILQDSDLLTSKAAGDFNKITAYIKIHLQKAIQEQLCP